MKKAKTIRDAFANGKAFIPFITAGDPDLQSTKIFILAMEKAGLDAAEDIANGTLKYWRTHK